MATSRPSVIDGLDVNEVKDGLVVYDPTADRVHYLNATASIVFVLADGKRSAVEISELMAKTYQLAAPPLPEVEECLSTLANEGMLR